MDGCPCGATPKLGQERFEQVLRPFCDHLDSAVSEVTDEPAHSRPTSFLFHEPSESDPLHSAMNVHVQANGRFTHRVPVLGSSWHDEAHRARR